jgi:hypothetical protein
MAYELRLPGRPAAQFETEQDAVAAARRALEDNPDAEPDIIDLATGKPAAPGSSKNWREELKNRVGF